MEGLPGDLVSDLVPIEGGADEPGLARFAWWSSTDRLRCSQDGLECRIRWSSRGGSLRTVERSPMCCAAFLERDSQWVCIVVGGLASAL